MLEYGGLAPIRNRAQARFHRRILRTVARELLGVVKAHYAFHAADCGALSQVQTDFLLETYDAFDG